MRRAVLTRLLPAIVLAILVSGSMTAQARAVWLTRRGDMLHVGAARLGLLAGPPLARLKDGRTVRAKLSLAVAGSDRGPFTTLAERRFVLSFDLWEERFAAVRADPPTQAISHLGAADAESWCVAQLALPYASLPPDLRGVRAWLRLAYELEDEDQRAAREDEGALTLRGLIDRLSRRTPDAGWSGSVVSGPVRIE